MNIVLLSGGSGKRLWPLSNDIRSKQFIKLFKNNNGQYESMIQRVYRQIKEFDKNISITIAASKTQVSAIHSQLSDEAGICVEPCRRDTFPAVALATSYLHDIKNVSEDEVVVVCPVDPYVGDQYFAALRNLADIAEKGDANISLIGIEPTYPSEKYGYIIPDSKGLLSKVNTFKEKPDNKTAQEYIGKGALWNGGVFAYKIGYMLKKSHQLIDFSDYYDLYSRYDSLNKISFDYAVLEQEDNINVMRYQGEWKDLGTWNTLTETMEEKVIGKAFADDSCNNVHIINELDIPVLCMGLSDIVVAAGSDGILVSDKNRSESIKACIDNVEQDIMYAENLNKPFMLKPCGKDYLWGGNRLNEDFSKDIKMTPLAETWECSTHHDGQSIAASGKHRGCKLGDVLKENSQYLGKNPQKTYTDNGELPVMIKLIDARQNLSIQVHPDDEYASQFENGERGKTEMWYILDADKDSEIIYGFCTDIDKETLKKSINENTLEKYLQHIRVKKDDVFMVDAGTVHAIGAGVLAVEIQENSNLTYRLYDYDRTDKNGKKRELHIQKALDVVNLRSGGYAGQPARVLQYRHGYAVELLGRCKYFQVERILLNTERCREMADMQTNACSFQVFLCIDGCGALMEVGGDNHIFFKGDCMFLPAESVPLKLHGKAQLLRITC